MIIASFSYWTLSFPSWDQHPRMWPHPSWPTSSVIMTRTRTRRNHLTDMSSRRTVSRLFAISVGLCYIMYELTYSLYTRDPNITVKLLQGQVQDFGGGEGGSENVELKLDTFVCIHRMFYLLFMTFTRGLVLWSGITYQNLPIS